MIENILNKLDKVKKTNENQWVACCPVHGDKNPSMGIKETPEGKILLHCFSCQAGAIEIIEAIGLETSELFPPEADDKPRYNRQKRQGFSAETLLKSLYKEANIISIAACDMANGVQISTKDAIRINEANEKIRRALDFLIKDY